MLKLKLNQNQLDLLATRRLSNEDGQLIAGLALIAWGIVAIKSPENSDRLRTQAIAPNQSPEPKSLGWLCWNGWPIENLRNLRILRNFK